MVYEHVEGTLSASDTALVEAHVQMCPECSALFRDLTAALSRLGAGPDPCGLLPKSYWEAFPSRIASRTRAAGAGTSAKHGVLEEAFETLLRLRGIAAICGVLGLIVLTFVLWPHPTTISPGQGPEHIRPLPAFPAGGSEARMDRYLQRSKILLVGLNNMPEDARAPIDITEEQKASRELAREARELKRQPLDVRSARLVDDLENIQTALAGMSARDPRAELERVRHGIRRQNLLFKVRMAEALSGPDTGSTAPDSTDKDDP